MKIWTLLVCLNLLVCGCGSDTQPNKTTPNDQKKAEAGSQPNAEAVADDVTLTIQGEDVWIRDFPRNGSIIGHPHEGDRYKAIALGVRDTIEGDSGWWYVVDFHGQLGWVFGGHTSWSGRTELTVSPARSFLATLDSSSNFALIDSSPYQLWQRLVENRQQACRDYPYINDENGIVAGLECEQGSETKLQVRRHFDFDEWHSESYSYQIDTISSLWISRIECINGSGSFFSKSLIGSHFENWQLNGIIDGYLKESFELNSDTTFFVFVSGYAKGDEGQDFIDLWVFSNKTRALTKFQTIEEPMWFIHPDNEAITHLEAMEFNMVDGRIRLTIRKMRSVDKDYEWNSSSGLFELLSFEP